MIEHQDFSYTFDENACASCGGNCCVGESGFIWINPSEMRNLAILLGIEIDELKQNYLFKDGYKFSIKEKQDETLDNCCIFFDVDKKQCSVYMARPMQCRTFPFWGYFKDKIEEVCKECPGIKV